MIACFKNMQLTLAECDGCEDFVVQNMKEAQNMQCK